MIPAAEALILDTLIQPGETGVASRVLARSAGGNVTLFAFDAGKGLTEHTTAFDALAFVISGSVTLTIGGTPVLAADGALVRLPANVPHAVNATEASRMLLMMLRDQPA